MRPTRSTWSPATIVFSLALVGCPADDTGSTAADAGPTTTDTSATATTPTSTASTDQPTSASGTSQGSVDGSADSDTGDVLCPVIPDAVAPSVVTIDIVNNRAEGVWLPMNPDCLEPVPWTMTTPDGSVAAYRSPSCGTCEGAAVGNCPCPPPFCEELTGLYLEPGASTQYSWSGLLYVSDVLADTCPGLDMCSPDCGRAVLPDEGTHTFTVQAGSATGCNGGGDCMCTPVDGACTLLDYDMTFDMLVDVEAELMMPGGTSVQLLIE